MRLYERVRAWLAERTLDEPADYVRERDAILPAWDAATLARKPRREE